MLPEIASLQPARFLRQHDRNAVADRIGQLGLARDQFLLGGVVFQRGLGQRADQDFQQLGIDAAFGPFGGGDGGHGADSRRFRPRYSMDDEHYCNGGSPSVFFLASSISVMATRISARVFRSGASSI